MGDSIRKRTLIREVNARIGEISAGFGNFDGTYELYCECDDGTCVERLTITAPAYERARSRPRTYLVVPGHASPEDGEVVEHLSGYAVVRVLRRESRSRTVEYAPAPEAA